MSGLTLRPFPLKTYPYQTPTLDEVAHTADVTLFLRTLARIVARLRGQRDNTPKPDRRPPVQRKE